MLGAAVEEFAEHGYADAKIDRIASRVDLTRGAVYSNFPSKRSLYLAVLLDSWPHTQHRSAESLITNVTGAAEAFARSWIERLPLTTDNVAVARLRSRSVTGVFDDDPGRAVLGELTRLEALLLALSLESCPPVATRRVRLAELILTLLHGADHLAEAAPGFGDPFDVTKACGHLAGLDLDDAWAPPHLDFVRGAELCDDPWPEPEDGLVVVLGAARLGAAEEAVRAATDGERVTIAVVTDNPAETGALVQLRLSGLAACLRQTFPAAAAPPVHVDLDDGPALAAAIGAEISDNTEAAVRIRAGRVVARAHGRGAGHAVANAHPPTEAVRS
ncbi:TetR/AcrR family transcriptional regulator [Actinoplanes couchii]|uniref:TetR family transcriptional regulator n=1 Tax=Actinoplanes couchii TaxID=403638 RepID=A0ABQ3XGR2_9ACTN|nr:TetR family transcriptional regulator [Actinoplanes couchii]